VEILDFGALGRPRPYFWIWGPAARPLPAIAPSSPSSSFRQTSSKTMAANNYGAVDVPAGNDHYDEGNTRYLNQTPFKWGRFFRAAVPILIALLIMGGFGYGMSHG
jgi:hypothetical protein